MREQERASALAELELAERARDGIAAELQRVERRLIEIDAGAGPPPPGTVASAGALAAGSRQHSRDRERTARLENERSEIIVRLGDAEVAVERAREAVANAARALRKV